MSIADKLTTIAENEQKVFNAGAKSERDRFWDSFQQNGELTNYTRAFSSSGWNDNNFKPKYDIIPTNCSQMFLANGGIKNLKGILEAQNVTLNTQNCANFLQMFYSSTVTHIPTIDLTNATNTNYIFNSSQIDTIEQVIVSETTPYNNCFTQCSSLRVLYFYGTIGQNGLNLSKSSNLTKTSLMSVINCLKDYSEDASGTVYKVTLGEPNLAKLTTEEINIAINKGWTVV